MHLKKALTVLTCLICVFVFSAVADYTVTTGTMPLHDIKGELDLVNFIRSACPER